MAGLNMISKVLGYDNQAKDDEIKAGCNKKVETKLRDN